MRRETVEMDERFGKHYSGTYVFQEITWARRNRIIQRHTKYHPITGQVVKSDYVAIQGETIWASLREQPENKPITLEKLLSEDDGIPVGLGELFAKVVNRLSSVTHQDLRFLLEQLDEESRIRLFLSFGFVRNSDGPHSNSDDNQPEPSRSSS